MKRDAGRLTQAAEDKPQTFVFMLVEGMSMMSLASAIEPLRSANRLTGRELYRWRAGSLGGHVMHASNGIPLMPEPLESLIETADVLLVCGGARVDMPQERSYLAILRNASRRRISLADTSRAWPNGTCGMTAMLVFGCSTSPPA